MNVLINMIGSCIIYWERVQKYILSLYPSYIEEVIFFDEFTQHTQRVHTHVLLIPVLKGRYYYVIKIWHHPSLEYRHYFLEDSIIVKTLGTDDLNTLTTNHIVDKLDALVALTADKTPFAAEIDNIDITKQISKYLPSLAVPNNLTPASVWLLYCWISSQYIFDKQFTLKITDFNLDERIIRNDSTVY